MKKNISLVILLAVLFLCWVSSAWAEAHETAGAVSGGGISDKGMLALASAIAMGLSAIAGTYSQSSAIRAGLESIGRNPAASGKIFTPMILGLALIESLVILSFVIAYMLQGKV